MKFVVGLLVGAAATLGAIKVTQKSTLETCMASVVKSLKIPENQQDDQTSQVLTIACTVAKNDPNKAIEFLMSIQMGH